MSDMNSYYMDRVITVTGNLDDAIKAEEMLSEKMRQCFEQDANMYQVRTCVLVRLVVHKSEVFLMYKEKLWAISKCWAG